MFSTLSLPPLPNARKLSSANAVATKKRVPTNSLNRGGIVKSKQLKENQEIEFF